MVSYKLYVPYIYKYGKLYNRHTFPNLVSYKLHVPSICEFGKL